MTLGIGSPAGLALHHCASSLYLRWWTWWTLERLSIEYRKTKTKVIILANQKGRRQSSKPIKTRSNYTCRHKARENVHARATIGFGFTSDWLKKWRENFVPITEWSVITSSFDWFTGLPPSFLIDQSNHFGFSFTTLDWNSLYQIRGCFFRSWGNRRKTPKQSREQTNSTHIWRQVWESNPRAPFLQWEVRALTTETSLYPQKEEWRRFITGLSVANV